MKKFILNSKDINTLAQFGQHICFLSKKKDEKKKNVYSINFKEKSSMQNFKNKFDNSNITYSNSIDYYGSVDRIRDWLHELVSDNSAILEIQNFLLIKHLFTHNSTKDYLENFSRNYKTQYPNDLEGQKVIENQILDAKNNKGKTIFDWLELAGFTTKEGTKLIVLLE